MYFHHHLSTGLLAPGRVFAISLSNYQYSVNKLFYLAHHIDKLYHLFQTQVTINISDIQQDYYTLHTKNWTRITYTQLIHHVMVLKIYHNMLKAVQVQMGQQKNQNQQSNINHLMNNITISYYIHIQNYCYLNYRFL